MSRAAMFDAPRMHEERSRCKELVPFPRAVCLACGGPTRETTLAEPALLRHGGYGATRVTTFLLCSDTGCRSVRLTRIDEARPL